MRTLLALALLVVLSPSALAHAGLVPVALDGGTAGEATNDALPDPMAQVRAAADRKDGHRIEPWTPPTLQPPSPSSYSIEFTCPDPPVGFFRAPCPFRVVDTYDLLGNPGLAVDPVRPGRMAFASLHGNDAPAPHRTSRANQTHTTFTTNLYGADWSDNPYFPPSPPDGRNRVVMGEDVHAHMDESGTLYVASLYSHRTLEESDSPWEYTIAQWKFDANLQVIDYTFPVATFDNRVTGGRIETHWLLEIPELDRVVLLWRERAPEGSTVTIGGLNVSGWLHGAITTADPYSPWETLPEDILVGSCATTTNPVVHRTTIYVGCLADEAGVAVKAVEPGDLLLYAIDVEHGTKRVVSKVPINATEARLAIDTQGRMAIVNVDVVEYPPWQANETSADDANATEPARSEEPPAPERRVRAGITTSRLGQGWSRVHHFADDLMNGTTSVDSRINAILYRADTNTVHMIVRHETAPEDRRFGDAQWRKSLVVIDPIGTVLVNLDLDLSEKGEVYGSFGDPPLDEWVYGDTRDSIIEVNGDLWVAFADYAVVVVAGVIELDDRVDAIAFNQVPPVPEPVPVPAVSATAVNVGVGVVSGSVAAEALRRAIAARNAHHVGAGRGRR